MSLFGGTPSSNGSFYSDSSLGSVRSHPRAFAGFVGASRVFKEQGRHSQGTQWGQRAIAAMKADNQAWAEAALSQELADPDAVVCGGREGAPFCYASGALFTKEQMQLTRDELKEKSRQWAERHAKFITPLEWADIDEVLELIGSYAHTSLSKVVVGDTGMHLAVRFGSMNVANAYLEAGADPSIENQEGKRVAHVLVENHQRIQELLKKMAALEIQRNSTLLAPLSAAELDLLGREEGIRRKEWEYRGFAEALCQHFETRCENLGEMRMKAKQSEMMDEAVDPAVLRELDYASKFVSDKEALRSHLLTPPHK
ncbi:unnamed protein product [Chrysoparadoxa australica]